MTPEQFQRVSEIFEAARREPPERIDAFLDTACAGDAALRAEVESLLAHHDVASDTLDVSDAMARVAAEVIGADAAHEDGALPRSIAGYDIVRRIGEGGMGVVYQAQQASPRRTVALKVIRSLGASQQMLRRFELEAHLLGQLQHPGIARVYEAGTFETPQGAQPFLAMEYIDGRPILDYVTENGLDTRTRLVLFARVCDAVQFAHAKGVIHRDLKPANILVGTEGTLGDGGRSAHGSAGSPSTTGFDLPGLPKILDFGVARVTDADLQVCTLQTEVGQLVGTVPYMSPEQVAGDPDQVDTRSDVYALGVVLFQLLSGRLPYAIDATSIVQAAHIIRETEPQRLGTIDRAWRGDLETIVAKALEKDRSRRYATAAQFAADIRRYLTDEPVIARPATALYQMRKFARRNRVAVIGACAVVVALVAGIITTSIGMVQARDAKALAEQRLVAADEARAEAEKARGLAFERLQIADEARAEAETARGLAYERLQIADEARAEAETARGLAFERLQIADEARAEAEAINQFLKDMLWRADPASNDGQDLTLRQLLDDAAERIHDTPPANRRVEARIHETIGRTYEMMGRYEEATRHLQAAYDITVELQGADHADTMWARFDLANHYFQMERLDEADALLDGLYEAALTLDINEVDLPPRVLSLQGRMAKQRSDYVTAIDYFNRAVEGFNAVGQPGPAARDLGQVATLHSRLGNHEQAVEVMRQAIDATAEIHGATSAHVGGLQSNLGVLLTRQGKIVEAEKVIRHALKLKRQNHPAGHPLIAGSMLGLSNALNSLDRSAEALELMEEAVPMMSAARGPDSFHTGIAWATLARCKRRVGRFQEAEDDLLTALGILRGALPPQHPYTARALVPLSMLLAERGAFDEAAALADEALETYKAVSGARHNWTASVLILRGRIAYLAGDVAHATRLLNEARDIIETNGERNSDLAHCLTCLGELALLRGAATEAEGLFSESLAIRATLETRHPEYVALTESGLGASLLSQGRTAEAEPLIVKSTQALDTIPAATPRMRALAQQRLTELRARMNGR